MLAKFGPGGNSEAFYREGGKTTLLAPQWIKSIGLDAYEYEAGNGISASPSVLSKIGEEAKLHGIKMSLHAPYFISLSGINEEKRMNSIKYLQQSVDAAHLLGADIIVVHTGSAAKISRDDAMKLAADTLTKALNKLNARGVKIGLETMGKLNQLGTLDEVIELCKIDGALVPVVDFGHMNARNCGGLFNTADDYLRVFDKIDRKIGKNIAEKLHCHFSKIEWSKAGEIRHLTFEDSCFGPDFEPLIKAVTDNGLAPTIICESAGTQSNDSLRMKKYYMEMIK